MLASLSQEEREEFEVLLQEGVAPFEALERVTTNPDAFKELAKEWGYEFALEPPEEAEEAGEGVYRLGNTYYTHNPALVPGGKVVVIPPQERKVGVSEEEVEDFWVKLIAKCVKNGWGDVHFEPSRRSYRVRIRNNVGLLETYTTLSKRTGEELLRQLLVRASIRTEATRIARDGSINFSDLDRNDTPEKTKKFLKKLDDVGTPCSLRISVIPTVKGESAVIRVLPKKRTAVDDLLSLNYKVEHEEKLLPYTKLGQGLIVISGPTGSGKSTLSWWFLKKCDPYRRKIVSVEDPVEAEIDGVQQVEVRRPVYNERGQVVGIDFALALRAFVRQNPEVIVVGETRDNETARTVVEAANTGHLVITTVHANDEVETLKRILYLARDERTGEVDIPAVVNALRLIIAQRLLPKVCPNCLKEGRIRLVEVSNILLSNLPAELQEVLSEREGDRVPYVPEGFTPCGKCKGGYVGRVPVVGILEFTKRIRDFIIDTEGKFTREEFLRVTGRDFKDYRKDAIERLVKHEVTLNDLVRYL